jgi:hypothetical protein
VNSGGHARPLRSSRRHRRSARHRTVGALLFLVVPIAVLRFTPFMAVLSAHAAGVGKVAGFVGLVLTPALLIATTVIATRAVRRRRDDGGPQPDGPPIERLAADLRRLLWNHDRLTRSADVAMCAGRLRALEGAITICAMQAARSLEVAHPDQATTGELVLRPQLRLLLRSLAAAGLVLPLTVALLAPDSRH